MKPDHHCNILVTTTAFWSPPQPFGHNYKFLVTATFGCHLNILVTNTTFWLLATTSW